MKLMTKEVEASLPPLYSQEHTKDPVVKVKYFCACSLAMCKAWIVSWDILA